MNATPGLRPAEAMPWWHLALIVAVSAGVGVAGERDLLIPAAIPLAFVV